MTNPAEQRAAIDAQLVHRLDRIEAAYEKVSQAAFNTRFAAGRGFADWTAMNGAWDKRSILVSRAMFFADRAYRATQVAA